MTKDDATQAVAAPPVGWLQQRIRLPDGALKPEIKPIVVLLVTPVLISLLWYYGRMPFYRKVIAPTFFPDLSPETTGLVAYYYLAVVSIITRLLIPMGIIVFVFRERLRDFGFRVRGTAGLARVYLGLLAFMLPILFYVSSLPGYQAKYPMYAHAGASWKALLLYELSYFFVFLSGEAFWRGFMVHALAPRFGLYGLAIMSIPYAMIHFGKPFTESMGAIITGVVLGYLSLKHRSFWLGVALHATIGVSMDVFCLWRKGLLF